MKKINEKGFTLIELLVVIAIIGLLSTLAVVSLNNARAKSRDAKRVADVKQMQTALELYYNDCSGYPTKSDTILDPADDGGAGTPNCDGGAGEPTFGDYMSTVPTPPTPSDGGCATAGPGGTEANTYAYTSYYDNSGTWAACDGSMACSSYTIEYCLGATTGGLSAGAAFASPAGM